MGRCFYVIINSLTTLFFLIMPFSHMLLALSVVFIWGINFIFIKLSLVEFSPLWLCALRFLLASIPAVFFIKPPAAPFRSVLLYGLVMFALQFAFLFLGLHLGMTAGMASLIVQVQVFFSMFFAAIVLGERPSMMQVAGALLAFSGIAIVAFHLDDHISMLGFLCMMGAAASWGVGNLMTKKMSHVCMMSLVVWGCFIASVPMVILALMVEGPASIIDSYHHVTWIGVSSLLYTVCISTWVGYGVWNRLIRRYPLTTVVPFMLLTPLVGMLSSILLLGESFQLWKLASGCLVMGGLYINILNAKWLSWKLQQQEI
jgi:O-acetylserine/cysteine efflux transporter